MYYGNPSDFCKVWQTAMRSRGKNFLNSRITLRVCETRWLITILRQTSLVSLLFLAVFFSLHVTRSSFLRFSNERFGFQQIFLCSFFCCISFLFFFFTSSSFMIFSSISFTSFFLNFLFLHFYKLKKQQQKVVALKKKRYP